ncbi:phosphatidylinositol-glycan biosynthesis class X protein [Ornithorhynchus anatinus]|nr:phosphatidylinositol-glycan biosynthesis class X protein [Ornithorhynchus anatinus]
MRPTRAPRREGRRERELSAHAPCPRSEVGKELRAHPAAPLSGLAACAPPPRDVRAPPPAAGPVHPIGALAPLGAFAAFLLLAAAVTARQDVQSTCSETKLTQDLLKEGFHRDLLIEVELGGSVEDTGSCRVLLKQEIPSGLYVDPFELASLEEDRTAEVSVVPDFVDVEAPEYLSKEFDIFIYTKAIPERPGSFRAVFPIHSRYHRPQEQDGVATVVLKKPELLVHCLKDFPTRKCWKHSEMAAPCSLRSEQMCHWSSVEYILVSKEVRWNVPVGLTGHTPLVCLVTLLTTIFCCIYVLAALLKHGRFSEDA